GIAQAVEQRSQTSELALHRAPHGRVDRRGIDRLIDDHRYDGLVRLRTAEEERRAHVVLVADWIVAEERRAGVLAVAERVFETELADVDPGAKRQALAVVITELITDPTDDEAVHRRLDPNGRKYLVLIRDIELADQLRIG